MNKSIYNLSLTLIVIFFFFVTGCNKKEVPVVITSSVTDIEGTTAICGGEITDDGGETVITRGVCWSTNIKPTITNNKTSDGTGAGSFSSTIINLSPATSYYVRAYATSSSGTGYGATMSFNTLGESPVALTQSTTNLLTSSVTLNGLVSANYLSTTVVFEYGTSTEYGLTIDASPNVITGNTITTVIANLSGLAKAGTYHYRVKAKNSLGVTYGNDMTFEIYKIVDIEGNIYSAIQIGTQVWMAENLKTTKFNDNTDIPLVTDNNSWISLTTPGYCWYNNDETSYKNNYGALYNWYCVSYGKLCPVGWHVPTNDEFTILANYLGGVNIAGGKIKESGYVHWSSPNTGATNETDFTALPGGQRTETPTFDGIGSYGVWWSSTPYNSVKPWYRSLGCTNEIFYVGNGSLNIRGFSIRCIKD
jgi:uncharacterized protein (TIGR02145 family)